MEIRQLRAFAAIAEAKTFTAGARHVNVTQAAISMQIRQLEGVVGLPLFERVGKRLALTPAGELFRHHAARVLGELQDAEQALQSMKVCAAVRRRSDWSARRNISHRNCSHNLRSITRRSTSSSWSATARR